MQREGHDPSLPSHLWTRPFVLVATSSESVVSVVPLNPSLLHSFLKKSYMFLECLPHKWSLFVEMSHKALFTFMFKINLCLT